MKLYSKILLSGMATVLLHEVSPTQRAFAAQEIVLTTDQTQILKLPEAPSKIILGNPSVADVTTDGNSMLLHPRGYGLTNLILLDANGKKLGDYVIRVIFEDAYSLSMFSPKGQKTFSCRKNCQIMLHIGDQNDYFSNYSSQLSAKNALALGQPIGPSRDATQPPPPEMTEQTVILGAPPAPQ